MLRFLGCCCCPTSSLGGNRLVPAKADYSQVDNPALELSVAPTQHSGGGGGSGPKSQRMGREHGQDDELHTFSIELDDEEEDSDEEEEAALALQQLDLEALESLTVGGPLPHVPTRGYAKVDTWEPHKRIYTPTAAAAAPSPSAPASSTSPASSGASAGGLLTSRDLEVNEYDPDLERFRKRVERVEKRVQAGKAPHAQDQQLQQPESQAHPSTLPTASNAQPLAKDGPRSKRSRKSNEEEDVAAAHSSAPTAATPVIPAVASSFPVSPSPVQLPSRSTATLLPPPPSSSYALTPVPLPSNSLPLVVRKNHPPPAASLPVSPNDDLYALLQLNKAPPIHASQPKMDAVRTKEVAAEEEQEERKRGDISIVASAAVHPSPSLLRSPSAPASLADNNPSIQLAIPATSAAPVKPQPSAAPSATAPSAPSVVTEDNKSVPQPSPSASSPLPSNPLDRLGIPSGPLTSDHLSLIMRLVKDPAFQSELGVSDVGYGDLFAFLCSASRSVRGELLKPFLLPEMQAIVQAHLEEGQGKGKKKKEVAAPTPVSGDSTAAAGCSLGLEAAKLLISFLHWLVEIRMDASTQQLHLTFHFGPSNPSFHYIDLPSQDTWVLSSKHPKDRFLVHPDNKPKIYRNTSHRLCLQREMVLNMGEQGVKSIRSGDVTLKKFVSFNAELRTEYRPGMVEYDDSKNAFIQMRADDPSKPLIVNGHYQPRTFDYWLVLTVLKQENYVGLPIMGKQAPPDLNMKPHKDYPYP